MLKLLFACLYGFFYFAHAQSQTTDPKANLQAQEQAAKALYAADAKACLNSLAPAQCQRQARLNYQQAQHTLKLKRDALDAATKQAKHEQSAANRAQNASTTKHGVDAGGKPLERAPLAKARPAQGQVPAHANKPLAKGLTAKPLKPTGSVNASETAKAPLAKKASPKASTTQASKTLSAQPTPEQRRANVATFAKKELDATQRKSQAQTKQAKRAAKDAQRREQGFVVDKP